MNIKGLLLGLILLLMAILSSIIIFKTFYKNEAYEKISIKLIND